MYMRGGGGFPQSSPLNGGRGGVVEGDVYYNIPINSIVLTEPSKIKNYIKIHILHQKYSTTLLLLLGRILTAELPCN